MVEAKFRFNYVSSLWKEELEHDNLRFDCSNPDRRSAGQILFSWQDPKPRAPPHKREATLSSPPNDRVSERGQGGSTNWNSQEHDTLTGITSPSLTVGQLLTKSDSCSIGTRTPKSMSSARSQNGSDTVCQVLNTILSRTTLSCLSRCAVGDVKDKGK